MAQGMGLGFMRTVATPAVVWPAPDYASVAASVAGLFRQLGLEAGNPLGRWIQPGMTVTIKPNWVKHESGDTENQDVLFTHSSLIRVLLDAALTALRGDGRIIVADAPLQGSDFVLFREQSGLREMERDYARGPVEFLDLRKQAADIDDSSYVRAYYALPGDPRGYSLVNLGPRSRLAGFGENARFGVTDYHAAPTHKPFGYPVSNSVLAADVILNVPKLKAHMKTGMTGALKNFIGIVGSKDYLPHFRFGSPGRGGDEIRTATGSAAPPVRCGSCFRHAHLCGCGSLRVPPPSAHPRG